MDSYIRQTSPTRPINVNDFKGCFLPTYKAYAGVPVTIFLNHTTDHCVMVFRTVEMLITTLTQLEIPQEEWKISQINDGGEFVDSIFSNQGVRIILDFHTKEDGKGVWTEYRKDQSSDLYN